ncbi:MAG: hypothetical protein WAL98_01590 [Desulfatiglandaceae bacterium]|jgi:hypothetical protein
MSNEWEENLRVFFERFLIVHLAPNPEWPSISTVVFRKHLKKSVRLSS